MAKTTYSLEELEQQLSESRREFRAADATINNLELKLAEMESQLDTAESKCAALAAENAALKRFPEQIIGFVGKLGTSEIGSSTREAIESAAKRIKTPSTDAFLAEVRAQGLEMAITVVNDCSNNICAGGLAENRQYEEAIVNPYLDGIHDELQEIAAQLRREAAK